MHYDLQVKATKKSGKEGFLVAFGVKDTGNYYWVADRFTYAFPADSITFLRIKQT
ncbi:hypothetical protein SY2F82_49410 [Streptomyces sp. Y2F8-2]|nr:hypothetical protein SY2F82_49410 [Streptomyces sp. Y2F8-2]